MMAIEILVSVAFGAALACFLLWLYKPWRRPETDEERFLRILDEIAHAARARMMMVQ
jgi:uncharacterized membrane protein